MALIGIDKNYTADGIVGTILGTMFVLINTISASFSLGLPQVEASVGAVGTFIIIVLGAPIIEEGLFRGLLPSFLRQVVKTKNNFWVINLIQAVLFAIFHLAVYGSGFQTAFVGALLFGLIAGVVAEKTNSLLPSTIMHIIFNGFLYIMRFVVVGG